MRRLKTLRRPPIYPKTPGHLPCSSLTHPLPLSSRRPSVSFGGFGLTTKIVNRGKDLEFATDESIRKLDDMKAVMQRHEEGHTDIQSEVERMQAEVSDMAETVIEVKREAERVAEENEQSPQTVDCQR